MCSSDTEISLLKKQLDEARREAEAEKQKAELERAKEEFENEFFDY